MQDPIHSGHIQEKHLVHIFFCRYYKIYDQLRFVKIIFQLIITFSCLILPILFHFPIQNFLLPVSGFEN